MIETFLVAALMCFLFSLLYVFVHVLGLVVVFLVKVLDSGENHLRDYQDRRRLKRIRESLK